MNRCYHVKLNNQLCGGKYKGFTDLLKSLKQKIVEKLRISDQQAGRHQEWDNSSSINVWKLAAFSTTQAGKG
jgi:peroxiredoxin